MIIKFFTFIFSKVLYFFLVTLLCLQSVYAAENIIIDQRISLMKNDILSNYLIIKDFVINGKGDFSAVMKAAAVLRLSSEKILELFPLGTGRPDVSNKVTRSLSKIWTEWDVFEETSRAMGRHVELVSLAAKSQNLQRLKKEFLLLGTNTCRECHKIFRGPRAP